MRTWVTRLGATSITVEDEIGFNRINGYLVRASAGQEMTVAVDAPRDDVWLSIWGAEDGVVLESSAALSVMFIHKVPGSGAEYSCVVDRGQRRLQLAGQKLGHPFG